LMVRASKITDNMAIAAAHSLAEFARKRGIDPENIVPTMDEAAVFPQEAADVAMQAIADGVARLTITWDEAFAKADKDIKHARSMTRALEEQGFISPPPREIIEEALQLACDQILCKHGNP